MTLEVSSGDGGAVPGVCFEFFGAVAVIGVVRVVKLVRVGDVVIVVIEASDDL